MAGFRSDTCCLPSPRPGARQAGIPSARRVGLGHVRQPGRDGHVFNIDIPPVLNASSEPSARPSTVRPPGAPRTDSTGKGANHHAATGSASNSKPGYLRAPTHTAAGASPAPSSPRHPKRDAPCQVRNQSRLERGHTFSPIWGTATGWRTMLSRPHRTRWSALPGHSEPVIDRQYGIGREDVEEFAHRP